MQQRCFACAVGAEQQVNTRAERCRNVAQRAGVFIIAVV